MGSDKLKIIMGLATSYVSVCKYAACGGREKSWTQVSGAPLFLGVNVYFWCFKGCVDFLEGGIWSCSGFFGMGSTLSAKAEGQRREMSICRVCAWLAVALRALCWGVVCGGNKGRPYLQRIIFPLIRTMVSKQRKEGLVGAGNLALSISRAIDCPRFSI